MLLFMGIYSTLLLMCTITVHERETIIWAAQYILIK